MFKYTPPKLLLDENPFHYYTEERAMKLINNLKYLNISMESARHLYYALSYDLWRWFSTPQSRRYRIYAMKQLAEISCYEYLISQASYLDNVLRLIGKGEYNERETINYQLNRSELCNFKYDPQLVNEQFQRKMLWLFEEPAFYICPCGYYSNVKNKYHNKTKKHIALMKERRLTIDNILTDIMYKDITNIIMSYDP